MPKVFGYISPIEVRRVLRHVSADEPVLILQFMEYLDALATVVNDVLFVIVEGGLLGLQGGKHVH